MSMSGRIAAAILVTALLIVAGIAPASGAPPADSPAAERARYWTAERRAAAVPRDLVLDEQGRGYLRQANGSYRPYGKPSPSPSGGGDTVVSSADPNQGAVIGASYPFKATVTDPDGVKSVTFNISGAGATQAVAAARTSKRSDVWTASVQGLTDGAWQWTVTVKDGVRKSPNTSTSSPTSFTVSAGTSGGGGTISEPDIVKNAEWTYGGDVQNAAGRIYFEMPTGPTGWGGYVCSGTAANDGGTNRSIVITAAHCVYDDVYKVFARNVLFIPNQDGTTGSGTDTNCSNDPLGCWEPSHGVVDVNWTTRTWPDNIPWDYAYYVVPDTGHTGNGTSTSLDGAVNELSIKFTALTAGAKTHALGYSYDQDPNFMYCAEGLGTGAYSSWWLGNCGLSGGASGGPWAQPMDLATGSGPIISVNSWGYRNQPGMAGPRLAGTSASCVFTAAKSNATNDTRGYKASC